MVKTTFLYGELDEEVYMKQPERFVLKGQENKVCKLVKSLYGLKQAPKWWHQKFDETILSFGFNLNQADKCAYSKFDNHENGVIICLYMDDMFIFVTSLVHIQETKDFLSKFFQMKYMGKANVILGIKIKRDGGRINLSQSHYIEKMLNRFKLQDTTPVSSPIEQGMKFTKHTWQPISQLEYAKIIGWHSLMYAMTCTILERNYKLWYNL